MKEWFFDKFLPQDGEDLVIAAGLIGLICALLFPYR